MVCLYADDEIAIYSILDDNRLPLIYHYEIYSDRVEKMTHIDIRNLKTYDDLKPSIFDLISIHKREVISRIINLAIKNNEIDFTKNHQ